MDLEKCESAELRLKKLLFSLNLNDEERVFVTKNLSSHFDNLREVNFHILAMHNAFNAK